MTGANYRRGFDAEKRLLKMLKDTGWWCERMYASKGTFDIIAVSLSGAILFIQVKRSKRNVKSTQALINQNREDITRMQLCPARSHASRELWIWIDPQKGSRTGTWRRLVLYGKGIIEREATLV